MPKTRAGKASERKPPDGEQSVSPLRIDGAHTIPSAEPADPTDLPEVVAALAEAQLEREAGSEPDPPSLQALALREEQLQLQAAQLAGHLKARLAELDRREAQLNARIAQLEADLRTARLWQREREYDFQQREAEL
jgi:hypothetical protein